MREIWACVKLTEVEEGDQCTNDNGPIPEELGREKCFRCEFLACLPEREEDQSHASNN
jgi:hypothetical protein